MKSLGEIERIGEAWIAMLNEIVEFGKETTYTDNIGEYYPVREVLGTTFTVKNAILPDPIIDKYMVPEEYEWMEKNFTQIGAVKELYGENSYASRLYSYMKEKNQVEWLVTRLKENPHTRCAAITTFEPLTDDKYIPCVSMLDFYVEKKSLDMYAYCRSLDFGSKAYVNLVMLYKIMQNVAERTDTEVGLMNLIVKSAHVYDRDKEKIDQILQDYKRLKNDKF